LRKGPTKILIADDDSMVRTTVSKILEMFGHRVETVSDGQGVIDLIDDSYDVIILDINMPDMDGLVFLREISRKFPSTNVIMITAYGGVESYLEAMNLGAYEYLHKPVRLEELRSVMKKIFNGGPIARVS